MTWTPEELAAHRASVKGPELLAALKALWNEVIKCPEIGHSSELLVAMSDASALIAEIEEGGK